MFKSKIALVALALVSAVALTACGGAAAPNGTKTTQDAKVDVKTGVAQMRQALEATGKAVSAADAPGAQKAALGIEEAWVKFEDEVKAKDKVLYQDIEDPLHAITTGVKSSPLDQKILTEQIAKLNGLLDKVK